MPLPLVIAGAAALAGVVGTKVVESVVDGVVGGIKEDAKAEVQKEIAEKDALLAQARNEALMQLRQQGVLGQSFEHVANPPIAMGEEKGWGVGFQPDPALQQQVADLKTRNGGGY